MLKVPDWGLASLSCFGYGHWSLIYPWSNFGPLIWFWRCKEHHVLQGNWRFLTEVWHLDLDLDMVTGLWYTNVTNIGSIFWFWGFKEHPCSLTHSLRPWRMLEASDCGLLSWSWFGYGHWSLIYSWSEFLLFILILKVQRTSMSFKTWFGALKDAEGSWPGSGIWILIWIWLMIFDTHN